jgi:hypothetical protein
MPVDRSQLRRMIDKMETALSIMERQQEARQKVLDDECDEEINEEQFINPLDAPPNAPFADSPPEKIHGEGKQDEFWPPKSRVPIPIETL